MKKIDLNKLSENVTIMGHTFKLEGNDEDCHYACRGEMMYDDEHDEMPEPSLWEAAERLERYLAVDGFKAEASHSEKGWVEVNVKNK